MKKTMLICGADGFIGKNALDFFKDEYQILAAVFQSMPKRGRVEGVDYISGDLRDESFVKSLFKNNHFILFGVNRFNVQKNGYYNSLVIINNKMEILQEYKKQKLVPFGEFLPFKKVLNKFGLKKITEGHGSYLRGENQKNLIS